MENETNIYDIFRRLEQTANLADSAGYLDLAVAIDQLSERYAHLRYPLRKPTCTKLHLV